MDSLSLFSGYRKKGFSVISDLLEGNFIFQEILWTEKPHMIPKEGGRHL